MFTTIKIQIMGNQGLCSKQELNEYLPTYLIQKQPFFGWSIYSQKAILKIKSAKIKCFLRILNSWKLI